MKKTRRKEQRVSASRRLAEHTSGGDKVAIKIPSSIPMFQIKKDQTYRVSVIPFEAGQGNPYADQVTSTMKGHTLHIGKSGRTRTL